MTKRIRLSAALLTALAMIGCGAASDDSGGTGDGAMSADPGANPGSSGDSADPGGTSGDSGDSSETNSPGDSGDSGDPGDSGSAGSTANEPPQEVLEQLDSSVDWSALTLVYDRMYSAYVEGHTFQVPVYVDGATIELGDWSAIPSSAVSFDPDPESGGVLITVLEDVPEITIAARSGQIGGTAPLFITSGTPEQWAMGEARYANGVELNIDFDLAMGAEQFAMMLLDPNWEPPPPEGDLACNNCHTTGAKYFEIQHTPTQAARFSDDELRAILTDGTKPEGVGYRVLPDMLGSLTADELYTQYHKWEASEDEIVGLIVYLRSLTPEGQGDILLPDGTYVEPGSAPPGL